MREIGPDFLSRIAAKAVGTAPLVEPRLPSRFEPRAERADAFFQDWEGPIEPAAGLPPAQTAPPLQRTAAAAVPASAGRIDPAPTEDGPEARPRKAEPGATRTGAVQTPPPTPAPPEPPAQASAPVHAAPPPAVPDLPAPRLIPPPQALRPAAPERAMPGPAFEPDLAAEREQVRGPRPAHEAAAPTLAAASKAEGPARAPHPQPLARDLAIPKPDLRPRPTRGALRSAEPMPPPGPPVRPPVVNITIGRVEVRAPAAGTAPPPRKAQPQQAAPQSLADYLKRRGAR